MPQEAAFFKKKKPDEAQIPGISPDDNEKLTEK